MQSHCLLLASFYFVQHSPFQNAGTAVPKILSMVVGDFNYDDIFSQDSSGESQTKKELPFPPVTYVLWVVFVILMPLLFNNLLVCMYINYRYLTASLVHMQAFPCQRT